MKYYTEKYYPVFITSVLTIGAWLKKSIFKDFHDLMCNISDNALSISVTLLGFFLTILTIINAIETRRMKFVKEANKYQDLINYLRNAITLNLVLIGASFIFKYFNSEKIGIPNIQDYNPVDFIYLFLFLLTMLSSFRFTSIFVSLLTDPKLEGRNNTK